MTSRSRLKGRRPVFCILLFWSHPHFCTSTIFLDFWHQSFLDHCRLWSTKTLTYSRVGHINTDSLPKGTETKEHKTSYHWFKVVMHFRHYYVCFSPSRVKMVVPYIVNNVKWLFEKKNAWTSQHLGRHGQSLLQWSGNGWLGKVNQCDMFWAGFGCEQNSSSNVSVSAQKCLSALNCFELSSALKCQALNRWKPVDMCSLIPSNGICQVGRIVLHSCIKSIKGTITTNTTNSWVPWNIFGTLSGGARFGH